jgi:RND family efflux transporter MFP subunit
MESPGPGSRDEATTPDAKPEGAANNKARDEANAAEHKPKGATTEPPSRPPRHLGLWGIVALVAAVAAAAYGIEHRRSDETSIQQWTQQQAVPTVAVITPQKGDIDQKLTLPGDIQAWYEAPIYARVSGYLKMWYFDYGAHVKTGDVLADIDAPDLDAQLSAAEGKLRSAESLVKAREAERQFAETTYTRWKDSPKGVVSEQEEESKKADYGNAAAQLNAAQAQVESDQGDLARLQALEGFKKILAPFDGVVTARETDIGALIHAGGGSGPELFKVADIHKMRVFVQVPQQQSAGIHSGLKAKLHLPQYPNKVFDAVVATTSGAINQSSRTLLVELHIDNPDGLLQPGAFTKVEFELPGDPDVVRIPTSALLFRERGTEVAMLGPNDKVDLKPVTLGRNLGTLVEVVEGLKATDRIINSPSDSLATGDQVRVAGDSGPSSADVELGSK